MKIETTQTGRPPGHGGQRFSNGDHWVEIGGQWYQIPARSPYKASELINLLVELGELKEWDEAPAVEPTLDARELRVLRHALGLDESTGEGEVYRNSYSAVPFDKTCQALEAKGVMKWRDASWMNNGGAWFVTALGIRAARAGSTTEKSDDA